MSFSYYWYDYETWGLDPRWYPPSQFAGIRTDEDFNEIGEPLNIYNQPTEDLLPDPGACLVTGITPQLAFEKGVPEPEFTKQIRNELMQPGTLSLGYNTIRFDEEFNRYLFWRNFYDPYQHTWGDDRGRWDIIDLVRMTRALRPYGIEWPVDDEGKPSNRLELLSVANDISHADAHDALSDVRATIALAKLIRERQPRLYHYLKSHRDKHSLKQLLTPIMSVPVVHTSDMYSSDYFKTSLVLPIAMDPEDRGDVVVFDLRQDPDIILDMSSDDLREAIFKPKDQRKDGEVRPALKTIKLNRAPAVAPFGVLDKKSCDRIQLDMEKVDAHIRKLRAARGIEEKIRSALKSERTVEPMPAEARLYEGFVGDTDKQTMNRVHSTPPENLDTLDFKDERLNELLFHYRGRHHSSTLSDEEQVKWHDFVVQKLTKYSPMTFERFGGALQEAANDPQNADKKALLEELQIYAESVYPY